MIRPDLLHTREEQQRLLTPHEHTGEAFSLRYQDCVSCGHRTEFTCIKCGYCYIAIGREQVEKIELRDNLKDFYSSLSKANNKDDERQDITTGINKGLRPTVGRVGNIKCTRSTRRTNMHLL